MSLQALISELYTLDVKLKLLDGDQLSISAPKGRLSDELMGRLKQHKTGLIEWLAEHRPIAVDTADSALPVFVPDQDNQYEPFPAADLQTAFLMGDGEDMEFHVRPHYYIEQEYPDLDPVRFERALNASLHRQRANLVVATEDMRLQTLRSAPPVTLKIIDFRTLSGAAADAALQSIRDEMARQILPIDRWPWFDCRISLYDGGIARLHFNNNNVFSDGYGTYKLLADAFHYYHHPEQPLPELSLSFRDCALGLAKIEESARGEASRRYWLDRLPNLPGPVAIPLNSQIDRRTRSLLERREKIVPEKVWSAFKTKARNHGLTPSNALYAVYAEVVSYWSGSRHFLLNNMVTHRFPLHPEIKEIVGNFASLYPLEVDFRTGGSFHERARSLQKRIVTDLQNVYWSGVKVLQALNQLNKSPGKAAIPFVVGSGLFMRAHDRPLSACLETPQVLLDHQFWELTEGELWYVWDVIERFFPAGLLDAMWDAYSSLLVRLAEDDRAWSEVAFDLLPREQARQRAEINGVKTPIPSGFLHDGLGRGVAKHPRKASVVSAARELTYAELHQQANWIARRLALAGAKTHAPVALILPKGWEQVAAAFGILQSGAAYVPIDPDWPSSRIDYLLTQTGATLAITSSRQCGQMVLPAQVHIIDVDDCGEDAAISGDVSASNPATDVQGLAYIIFTSGSTGMPKGVMIDHQGALNTVTDINRRFGISDKDVVFGISSLYFDLSVYDLFGTIAAGATLVLPDSSSATDPEAWLDAIHRHGVTVWNSVPALMQLLVDATIARGEILPTLRVVMLSGDWIPVSLPDQIRKIAPNARIVSLGGATEASIWSIYYPVEQVESYWTSIPYGKPLANQTWHVLNDDGRECPTWVTGHLHIGGAGLAMGYWNDREKTDAVFVHHVESGMRLYRTGDLGRYLPDGNIEFLGRSDFQVKIQGFRVELGEIEQALLACPAIRAATTIATGSAAGKQLIAFIVPDEASVSPDIGAVQDFLRGRLPGYMVPSQIAVLEQLPLTANGKVDRKALQSIGENLQKSALTYIAPSTPTEKKLVAIWQEVLDTDRIGIHDDFFELGGQSFAAVRMITRIGKQFGQRLPLSVLLEGRTVSALAKRLTQQHAWSPLVRLQSEAKGRTWFFVHPGGGNVLCYRHLAEKLGGTVYALQAPGLIGTQTPLKNIEQMATFYLEAMQTVQTKGPYLIGGWSSGGGIAFEIARQLEAQGEHVAHLLMIDAPAPRQHGPVDDATLLRWFLEDLDLGIDTALVNEELVTNGIGLALADVLDRLRERQLLKVDLRARQLDRVLTVFSHIVRAGLDYLPAVTVSADITVVRAEEGLVSEFANHPARSSSDWGWGDLTRGEIRCSVVHATHYTILDKKNAGTIAEVLRNLPLDGAHENE